MRPPGRWLLDNFYLFTLFSLHRARSAGDFLISARWDALRDREPWPAGGLMDCGGTIGTTPLLLYRDQFPSACHFAACSQSGDLSSHPPYVSAWYQFSRAYCHPR